MAERVVVAGAGMVPFMAPGSNASGMAERAIRNALDDAGIDLELVDQAVSSHVHGDPAAGERALARAGLTGIAVSNVSNACASGSVALFHARQALLSGEAQCVLAVGFEESIAAAAASPEWLRRCSAQLDGLAERNGAGDETFARVAVKARAHGARNPYAVHRNPLSFEEALAAPILLGRLRRSYVSGPSCGAAAVVLTTPRFAVLHGLRDGVLLAAQALESDEPGDADESTGAFSTSATRRVAERVYESAGVDPAKSTLRKCTTAAPATNWSRARRSAFVPTTTSSGSCDPGRTRMAAMSSFRPRADCFRWAMRRAQPGSRRSASSSGSFATKPVHARYPAHASPCNTTADPTARSRSPSCAARISPELS